MTRVLVAAGSNVEPIEHLRRALDALERDFAPLQVSGAYANPAVGFEGDDFVFAGKIGTGFDTKLLLELRQQLDKIEITKAPFTKSVGLPRVRAHWVKPQIVVQVGFIEWTVHGKLRHPRLLGVRTDKDAREVVRE